MAQLFLTAALSRLATEICGAKNHFLAGRTQLPKCYCQIWFYIICVLEAAAAGGLSLYLAGGSVVVAAAIGVALPTIIKSPVSVGKFLKSVR